MSTVSFKWTVEHLDKIDDRGRPMTKVTEHYLGIDAEPRTFMVPSAAHEAFVRARRTIVYREMAERGHTRLFLN